MENEQLFMVNDYQYCGSECFIGIYHDEQSAKLAVAEYVLENVGVSVEMHVTPVTLGGVK